jgi:hypothetical protein
MPVSLYIKRKDGYPMRVDAWDIAWSDVPLPPGVRVECADARAGSGGSHDILLHVGEADAAVSWSGSSGIVYLPLQLDEAGWSAMLNTLAEVARRLGAVIEDDDGEEVGPT